MSDESLLRLEPLGSAGGFNDAPMFGGPVLAQSMVPIKR